jgi:hypothetical protein
MTLSVYDFTLLNTAERVNTDDVRANSIQLEEFRQLDFSSMPAELARVIKETDGIELRPVPLVRFFSVVKSPLYRVRPTRTVGAATEGQRQKVADLLASAGLDLAYKEIEQRLAVHRTLIIAAEVTTPTTDAGLRGLRLTSYAPYEAHVVMRDPADTDPRIAARVVLRVPLHDDGMRVTFGRRVYTPDEVYTELPDGKRVGYYNPEGHNPFKPFLPLAAVRHGNPRRGRFWCDLPGDLLQLQIGLVIGLSDMEQIARFSSFPERVLTGEGAKLAAESMYTSPNRVLTFTGDSLDYRVNNPNPAIEKYILALEAQVESFERYHGLPSGTLSKGITGAAKVAETLPQREDRADSEERFSALETQVMRLLVTTDRETGINGLTVDADALTLDVSYNVLDMPENQLQRSQSRMIDFATGIDSAEEEVMRRDRVGKEEAAERVAERLESFRRNRAGAGAGVPGLDAIDKQLGSAAGGGAPGTGQPGDTTPEATTKGAPDDASGDATLGDAEGKTLNGAQITAALEVAQRVAEGALTSAGGLALLVEALGISEATARAMVTGAKPAEVAPTPGPPGA